MWLIILFNNQKFSIEVTGNETLQDIKNILSDAYGFSSNVIFAVDQTPISDNKMNLTSINEIPEFQGREIVETRIIIQDRMKKETRKVEPEIRQQNWIEMGLKTDISSAYEPNLSSSRRSNRSSSQSRQMHQGSNRLKDQPPSLRSNQKSQPKPAQNTQLKTAQNIQPKPAQNIQPKHAQNIQPKPAQNIQPKPAQNIQPKPAQNIQPKPAQNTPNIQPNPPQFNQPRPTQYNQTGTTQPNHPRPYQNAPASNEGYIQQIIDMGFSRNQAENALRATNNDVEAAIARILDTQYNAPALPAVNHGNQTQNSPLQELLDMGFSRNQAENALRATNNNVSSAVDYILRNS